MKTLILGIGNSILSDDGAGIEVAREVYKRIKSDGIDLAESQYGGWRLADLLPGYEKVVIIDVIHDEKNAPGECFKIESNQMTEHSGQPDLMSRDFNAEFIRPVAVAFMRHRAKGDCRIRSILCDKSHRYKCEKVAAQPPNLNHLSSHGIGFNEALELARMSGALTAQDVSIYAVSARNVSEFGEKMDPALAAKIPAIAGEIIKNEFEPLTLRLPSGER